MTDKTVVILDLFCGAGGAGMGYYRAGFSVVGVDIRPQPHYPFEFHQADALEYLQKHWNEFDAVHASPPCQAYSVTGKIVAGKGLNADYPNLIPATSEALIQTGLPYIIENVPGAPLRPDIRLNGLMFGLRVLRERWFETNWFAGIQPPLPKKPKRWRTNTGPDGTGYSTFDNAQIITVAGHAFSLKDARAAMRIDWMSRREIAQAIPPAYTEYIGRLLMDYLMRT